MKNFIVLLFLFPFTAAAQLNGTVILSGKVVGESHEGLAGSSIVVKGTTVGTTSDSTGKFSLVINQPFPFKLIISSVGFAAQEVEIKNAGSKLAIQLNTQTFLANEVVVTASRGSEKILKSPVSIEKLDIRSLKETPAASFYDALGNVKGVQLTTASLTFKVPNTRGFNIPNNFRFMQLVDGIDMQAATLGVPLGNAIGPTELDIQSIEITPGAASALYGMNAINGMSNLITKNPFTTQGLSIFHRTGVNHVGGDDDHSPSLLTETAIRYAKAFNNKFAFKINGSYLKGVDWISNTRLDQNPNNRNTANPAYLALNGANNQAFDGWNKYGDDALAGSNTVSIGGLTIDNQTNKTLTVARTGYWESDLVNPDVSNKKIDAALVYKFTPNLQLTYSYRFGEMDGVFQRGNKIKLSGVTVQNHQVELKGKTFAIKAYTSIENSGHSYNVKPLADNLDLYTGGSNSAWAAKYKNALNNFTTSNGKLTANNLATATQYARQQADAGRAEPGTDYFNRVKDSIIQINNWDIKSSLIPTAPVTGGAALIQKSQLYHIEGQLDLSKQVKYFNLLVGGDARIYQVIPDGNNFVDFSRPIADRNAALPDGSFGKDIYYKKFGGFVQVTKTLFEEKLKLWGSIRADKNTDFKAKYTPRLAAVYTINEKHNLRFTFQKGYRFPALFEALSYVNNGRVKRVGLLPIINEGLGYRDNSYTQSSVSAFNAAVKAAGNGDAAALVNKSLLVPGALPDGRPEGITSFEIGYKTVLFDNKLFIDYDAYTNVYDGFLGQVQVYVPIGETIGSDASAIAMVDRNRDATTASAGNVASKGQERYRVYTNAKNKYTSYGSSLGLTYNFYKTFTLSGNVNYNKIKKVTNPDLFITGFNTPDWTTNLSFGNRAITRNVGFNIVYKWQNSFLWESPLVTGNIGAINNVDAQVTLRVPQYKATIKLGGTNVLNNRTIQYAGGPTIGALYYLAITLDGLLNK